MVISVCKWFLLPVFILFSGFETMVHPFYASVTEIQHNAREKTLELSCRMFTDDLENTINRLYKMHIDLSAPADSAMIKTLVTHYIEKHLLIKADGKSAILWMAGYEREKGATWFYLQADGISTAQKIEITNSLLYESFPSQMSIMHVTVNGKRKSTQLTNPDKNVLFGF